MQGTNKLDSSLMRSVLVVIQAAALRGAAVSMRHIAERTSKSVSVIQRYCQALRESGLIAYEDHTEGTIRVKEWL